MAWVILSRSVSEALSYDTRLIPLEFLADVLSPLASAIRSFAERIVGVTFQDNEWERVQLPGA